MNETKLQLVYGALLHDVGKVVIRGFSGQGTHSRLGADFVRDAIRADASTVERVVEQIRYHHAKEMVTARLATDSLAYITYFADNISAGMDRKNEGEDSGFDRDAKLRKVFNVLCGHRDDNVVEHEDYNAIRESIRAELAGAPASEERIGSLLHLLEAKCGGVPSSTDRSQLMDVSLFDHAKTTAALATCLYDYLCAAGTTDYRATLFDAQTSSRHYDDPMFLLWSCDLSGIQDFIYQISGSGALKQLRARSFYLEMLLEHCMDELLCRLDLTRCNLLYTGGGHAYAIFPNTGSAKAVLQGFASELKQWLIESFGVDLFCACAFVPCSANDLMNKGGTVRGAKRYRLLYHDLAVKLSEEKGSRYTAAEIAAFNFSATEDSAHARECSECHRSDRGVDADGRCPLCGALARISPDMARKDVFVVSDAGDLALPFGKFLTVYRRDEYLSKKPVAARVYTKQWDTGDGLSTHLWMGDYAAEQDGGGIAAYAESSATLEGGGAPGIRRLGVLRADVDNLGSVFAHGLPDDKASISRTATLSRALSYFFKHEINGILEKRGYRVQIIYSGGDDLFLVGNWNDVIHAARDVRAALNDFTGNGVLTISAGIGMFDPKYPIARMADETGALEDAAKRHVGRDGKGKDAVALWTEGNVFGWDEFENGVCGKLLEIESAFRENDKGKAFVYKLVELLRNAEDPISIPRLAYLLARSFEDAGARGEEASRRFFEWATDEQERRSLVTALEWYVYATRERG